MMKIIVVTMLSLLAACASQPKVNLAELEAKASTGDATAQYELAVALIKSGRTADAVKSFEMSAKNGHPVAQNNLGVLYQHGQGVSKDSQKAFYWYKNSRSRGFTRLNTMSPGCMTKD